MSDGLRTSESIKEIAPAMVLAASKMGDVIKGAMNPAFKSKYADLATVIDAVHPALLSAGIVPIQSSSATYEDGNAIVSVETMLLHKSGEWFASTLNLRPSKSDPQSIGSAITYGRRYSLQAMCGVAPEDDDGAASSGPRRQQPAHAAQPRQDAPPQAEEISTKELIALHGGDTAAFVAWATTNVTGFDGKKLTPKQKLEAASKLRRTKDSAATGSPAKHATDGESGGTPRAALPPQSSTWDPANQDVAPHRAAVRSTDDPEQFVAAVTGLSGAALAALITAVKANGVERKSLARIVAPLTADGPMDPQDVPYVIEQLAKGAAA